MFTTLHKVTHVYSRAYNRLRFFIRTCRSAYTRGIRVRMSVDLCCQYMRDDTRDSRGSAHALRMLTMEYTYV